MTAEEKVNALMEKLEMQEAAMKGLDDSGRQLAAPVGILNDESEL